MAVWYSKRPLSKRLAAGASIIHLVAPQRAQFESGLPPLIEELAPDESGLTFVRHPADLTPSPRTAGARP